MLKHATGGIVLLVLAAAGMADDAEMYLPPRPLRLYLSGAELTVAGEQKQETLTVRREDSFYQYEQTYSTFVPEVGVFMAGSVYHPYFLDFQGRILYTEETYESRDKRGGSDETEHETTEEVQTDVWQYGLSGTFLKRKPYATSLYGSLSTSIQAYDFFTRSEVENRVQGVRSGYWGGAVPFSVSYTRSRTDERRYGAEQTLREEDRMTVKARNVRSDTDTTSLDYTMNRFRDEESEQLVFEGLRHDASVHDVQTFGTAGKTRLQSSLLYDVLQAERNSSGLNLQEALTRQHGDTLQSSYRYGFGQQTVQDSVSRNHYGSAGVSHRLFQSLFSSANVDVQRAESERDAEQNSANRYGGALASAYTKQIPTSGRLSMDVSMSYHAERDTAAAGSPAMAINEAHTLSGAGSGLLNQPDADQASIVVTDPTGTIPYALDRDFRVLQRGGFVEIQRIYGGRIPEGQTVLVDYEHGSADAATYAVATRTLNGQLHLYRELISFNGRLNRQTHSGGRGRYVDDVSEASVGAELKLWALTAGNSHHVYESTHLSYTADQYYERVSWSPFSMLSLYLDLGQSATTYENNPDPERVNSAMLWCDARLTTTLTLHLEGGRRRETSSTYRRDFEAVRGGLIYAVGRLNARVAYETTERIQAEEDRTQRALVFRIKRTF